MDEKPGLEDDVSDATTIIFIFFIVWNVELIKKT